MKGRINIIRYTLVGLVFVLSVIAILLISVYSGLIRSLPVEDDSVADRVDFVDSKITGMNVRINDPRRRIFISLKMEGDTFNKITPGQLKFKFFDSKNNNITSKITLVDPNLNNSPNQDGSDEVNIVSYFYPKDAVMKDSQGNLILNQEKYEEYSKTMDLDFDGFPDYYDQCDITASISKDACYSELGFGVQSPDQLVGSFVDYDEYLEPTVNTSRSAIKYSANALIRNGFMFKYPRELSGQNIRIKVDYIPNGYTDFNPTNNSHTEVVKFKTVNPSIRTSSIHPSRFKTAFDVYNQLVEESGSKHLNCNKMLFSATLINKEKITYYLCKDIGDGNSLLIEDINIGKNTGISYPNLYSKGIPVLAPTEDIDTSRRCFYHSCKFFLDDGTEIDSNYHSLSEWIKTEAVEQFTKDVHKRNLMVIYFNPEGAAQKYFSNVMKGRSITEYERWYTQSFIGNIRQATNNKVRFIIKDTVRINEFPVMNGEQQFTLNSYSKCVYGSPNFDPKFCENQRSKFSYSYLNREYNLCRRINQNEIDEIFLIGLPYVTSYENFTLTPDYDFYLNVNGPAVYSWECDKSVVGTNATYDRPDFALESFGHRAESLIVYIMSTLPSNLQQRYFYRFWDRDGVNKCGNMHTPANTRVDYDVDNRTIATFYCKDFRKFPNYKGLSDRVNCEFWGCNGEGWYKYWFSSVPNNKGEVTVNPKDPQEIARDWWKYILYPDLTQNYVLENRIY